jgi:hypothetical protein
MMMIMTAKWWRYERKHLPGRFFRLFFLSRISNRWQIVKLD